MLGRTVAGSLHYFFAGNNDKSDRLLNGTRVRAFPLGLPVHRVRKRPACSAPWPDKPRLDARIVRGSIMTTSWIVLIVAGLFETGWAIGLKYTDNFTRLWPSVLTAVSMAISVYMLSWSLKTIPVGTGYAIWTGIGALCTAILGMILFKDSTALPRLLCLGLIIAGIVGLKLVS